MTKTLKELRKRAADLGVTIEADRYDVPLDGSYYGYWLGGTGWDEGNYCADRVEVEDALNQLEAERAADAADMAKLARGESIKAMMPF
jgi:hypothetical protein